MSISQAGGLNTNTNIEMLAATESSHIGGCFRSRSSVTQPMQTVTQRAAKIQTEAVEAQGRQVAKFKKMILVVPNTDIDDELNDSLLSNSSAYLQELRQQNPGQHAVVIAKQNKLAIAFISEQQRDLHMQTDSAAAYLYNERDKTFTVLNSNDENHFRKLVTNSPLRGSLCLIAEEGRFGKLVGDNHEEFFVISLCGRHGDLIDERVTLHDVDRRLDVIDVKLAKGRTLEDITDIELSILSSKGECALVNNSPTIARFAKASTAFATLIIAATFAVVMYAIVGYLPKRW